MEPLGLADHQNPKTLLGYRYTPASIIAIAASSVLGLLVSLSTFLVIGSTSSLTYNVVGHVKTVIILLGGVVIFGDRMPIQKLTGKLLQFNIQHGIRLFFEHAKHATQMTRLVLMQTA